MITNRTTQEFSLNNPIKFKQQLLSWGNRYDEVVWLDSNEYPQKSSNFEAVLAVQAFTAIKTDFAGAFEKLREYQETTSDWIFGYLSYDLKNDVEDLSSKNFDGLGFPDLYFFQPVKIIQVYNDKVVFHYLKMVDDEIESDFKTIHQAIKKEGEKEFATFSKKEEIEIKPRISKSRYIEKVNSILEHIHHGDIYEMNFCQEFYAEDVEIFPAEVFERLNKISVTPFAAYLKFEEKYLMSASPERYLSKVGQKIWSQPIKGTARRSDDEVEDQKIAESLSCDEKERSENIMIVDLVRNDLSRVARKGSVKVEELCKLYTFQQVHQLISTVSAELEEGIPVVESIRSTFPMGSMTGAPKYSAMKIIEDLEETKRGLYSGAVGYFTPHGDFDFNVVIRSILYNSRKKYVSFSVGGAITSKSLPENEYEECLLKSRAMRAALQ